MSEDDDRKKEEEHVAASLNICGYLPGPLTRSNGISWRNHGRAKQRKDRTKEVNTKVWLLFHMWKDSVRHTRQYWSPMASPLLTVPTVHYGISWFIQRTRSKMRRKQSWSTGSLARTAPVLTLEKQAGSYAWRWRSTEKKWILSQQAHKPEPPEPGTAVLPTSPPSLTMLWNRTTSSTGTVQKWSPGRHIDKPDGSKRHFGLERPRHAWIGRIGNYLSVVSNKNCSIFLVGHVDRDLTVISGLTDRCPITVVIGWLRMRATRGSADKIMYITIERGRHSRLKRCMQWRRRPQQEAHDKTDVEVSDSRGGSRACF